MTMREIYKKQAQPAAKKGGNLRLLQLGKFKGCLTMNYIICVRVPSIVRVGRWYPNAHASR